MSKWEIILYFAMTHVIYFTITNFLTLLFKVLVLAQDISTVIVTFIPYAV